MGLLVKFAGTFEDVRIYETSWLGLGYDSGGLALPGFGIIVGKGVFSERLDLYSVKHEFGHLLQARTTGLFKFYLFIGIPSLFSAWSNGQCNGHFQYWTETWCNYLVKQYFSDAEWPEERFPTCNISKLTNYWLVDWA